MSTQLKSVGKFVGTLSLTVNSQLSFLPPIFRGLVSIDYINAFVFCHPLHLEVHQ